jgi:sialidase-1
LGLFDGQWHHYVLTVSADGSTVYLDGVSRVTAPLGGDALDPSGDLILGCRQDLNGRRYYGGMLHEVRIYNRALSAVEVASLAAAGIAHPGSDR